MVTDMGKIIALALAFASLFAGVAFYWAAGKISQFDWLLGMAVLAGTHFVFILLAIVAGSMKFSRRGKRPLPMRTPLFILLIGLVSGDTLLVFSVRLNYARERETEARGNVILERVRAFHIREKRYPKELAELGADLPTPAIEGSQFLISGESDEDFTLLFNSIGSAYCTRRLVVGSADEHPWRCED